jgi:glycosyltransferase involved in cell wall biosynthesis
MKSGTKLLILTPGFAADEFDSTSIPSLQLYLNNFHCQYPGVSIQIVSFHYPFSCFDYVWKEINVHAAGGEGRRLLKPFLWLSILKYLFKLKKERGIDIIHSFWLTDTTLIGLIFSKLTGVPIVATAMGLDVTRTNKYLWLIRLFRPDPVTISGFQAKSLSEFLHIKQYKVISFGTDNSRVKDNNSVRNIDILAAGSLNYTKNYIQFIQIVNYLVKRFPNLICAIAGEGNKRESIEKSIASEGLENHIKLLGELAHERVIEKMQECRILLHTSLFEGQGLVLTEALASGAYVVCYPVGIAFDIKHEKLLTCNSKEEMETNIISILNNQQPDYRPVIITDISETSKEYYSIYNALLTAI